MKKIVLSLITLIGLVSCGNNLKNTSSVDNQSYSNDSSSILSEENSSSETSSSSQDVLNIQEQTKAFITHLKALKTKVKEKTSEIVTSTYYLTNQEPLSITMKDSFTANRYVNSDVGTIIVQKGSVSFLDGLSYGLGSPYEMQTFHDTRNFYKITDYANNETDEKKVIAFDEKYEEQNFALDFVEAEIANFEQGLIYLDSSNIDFAINGSLNDFVTNGKWSYSYVLSIYEETNSSILAQQISYHNTLTLENGLIVKSEQDYANDVYVGGIKGNWLESKTTSTYVNGEYDNFEGTRFNPRDYA